MANDNVIRRRQCRHIPLGAAVSQQHAMASTELVQNVLYAKIDHLDALIKLHKSLLAEAEVLARQNLLLLEQREAALGVVLDELIAIRNRRDREIIAEQDARRGRSPPEDNRDLFMVMKEIWNSIWNGETC